jgi:hypothetical protein
VPKADRLWRLVGGEGDTSDERGGGVEPVALFTILLEMTENGPVEIEPAVTAIREAYEYKSHRLEALYREISADPFEGFTRDGLDQLVDVGLLEQADNRWLLTRSWEEVAGRTQAVIPAKGRRRVEVTPYPARIRELRDRVETSGRTAAGLLASRNPSHRGGGFFGRKLDEETVEGLVRSMERDGFWEWRPVLIDQDERVLDGYHRLAAAQRLGLEARRQQISVESDEHAIQIIHDANKHRGWTAEEERTWQAAKPSLLLTEPDRKRYVCELISFELDHAPVAADGKLAISLREIARRAGVPKDHKLVARELRRRQNRQDGALPRPPDSNQAVRRRVLDALRADPARTSKALGEELGVDPRTVTRVRADLEAAGEIDPVPLREQREGDKRRSGDAKRGSRKRSTTADPVKDDLANKVFGPPSVAAQAPSEPAATEPESRTTEGASSTKPVVEADPGIVQRQIDNTREWMRWWPINARIDAIVQWCSDLDNDSRHIVVGRITELTSGEAGLKPPSRGNHE